jgi:hypothetical protein
MPTKLISGHGSGVALVVASLHDGDKIEREQDGFDPKFKKGKAIWLES